MSPRTKEQFEEIREQKRKLIKDTALELFAIEGFHMISISKIAAKANISKGLLYNYFESKEELIHDIIFDGLDELFNIFDPDKDGILTDDEFEFFLRNGSQILQNNVSYWKLYFAMIFQPKIFNVVEEKFIIRIGPFFEILKSFFEKRNYNDPEMEAKLFGALIDGIALNYVLDPKKFPLNKAVDKLIHLYKSKK